MRQISAAYRGAALSDSLEPVFVAKLINDHATIYLTTRDVTITDPGSVQIQGKIKSASFAGQSIKPENGISTIGSMPLSFDDSSRAFTDQLTLIEAAGSSINNNKVELYTGFADIDFADYVELTPLYVRSFTAGEITYDLQLTDIQRITEKSLFADPLVTELVGNYGYSDTSVIECISPAGYPLVEHNADWAEDPNVTIGYLKVMGTARDGREVKEVISYTGYNATQFTGVQRSKFGTERVNLSATQDENAVTIELVEMVYIDLVQPAMLLALLTGDLYGQPGKTLPDSWHAGIDASLINTTSFTDIGGDLWQEHVEFRDLETEDAKEFIADQILAPYGVFLRIDQTGQYYLARYDYVSQESAGAITLDYGDLISVGTSKRDAQSIKNYFQISWGWRIDQDYYSRNDFYIDEVSQDKYSVESSLEKIELRGLRNRDKNSKPSLDFVAQSLVKRKSNPKITRTVTALINRVLDVEVGELVTIVADNEPDFKTGGTYKETFEVQAITFDFIAGRATLRLFASEGVPSQFVVANGDNVVSIDHTGYTNLDGSGYGVNDGGTFKFNNGANIASGRYYFDGDVELPASRTITANGSVYVDCDGFEMGANSKIDMKGRGASGSGYFGSRSRGQSGLYAYDPGAFSASRIYSRNNGSDNGTGQSLIKLPDVIRLTDGGSINDVFPSRLDGLRGAAGGDSHSSIGDTNTGSGGAEANNGGGILFSCTSFNAASSAIIDVSGDDNNLGGYWYNNYGGSQDQYYYHGASGFGWNGVCIVALKDLGAAKPFLYDVVTAKTGDFTQQKLGAKKDRRVWWTDSKNYRSKLSATYSDYYGDTENLLTEYADTDFATESNRAAIKVVNLVVAGDQVNDPVVDGVNSAPAPVFTATPSINVPRTAQGDQVTYELTATSDPDTAYVFFEYRLLPNGNFNPCEFVINNESKLQLTATGETIEIRATSYNIADKSGGSTVTEITLPLVTRETEESDGGAEEPEIDITVPKIKGLELINSIDTADNWDKFKSPNAEFRWKKLSVTAGGSITQLNGSTDLHLRGYDVRISRLDGTILREEPVVDSFFTYTFDKNKFDNASLDGSDPVRSFKIEVQAAATTGYVSGYTGFIVENPEPSAPAGATVESGFTEIATSFTLPTDVDFVGVDAYIVQGAGDPYAETAKRVSGNSHVFSGLTGGQTYTIGLKSVDQFGAGAQTVAILVETKLISSSELDDITTPLIIDESGGRLTTNNSGFIAFHGATDVPAESANPLIFGSYNGSDYVHWIDSAGDFSYGVGDSKLTFIDSSLRIGRGAVFAGNDSYGNDYLYRNVSGYYDFNKESVSYGLTISGINDAKATKAVLSGAGAGSLFARVGFEPEHQFSFGYLNFDLECRLKIRAGLSSHDDIFMISMGNCINNLQGAILLQFRGLGSGLYATRVASREGGGPYITTPDAAIPVSTYSPEHTLDLSGVNDIEITYTPKGAIKVYLNDVVVDELGVNYDDADNFFPESSLPSLNETLLGYQHPYFNITIINTGSATVTKYIGDVKFMNSPV